MVDQHEVHVLCGQPNRLVEATEFVSRGTQVRNQVTIHRLPHTTFAKHVPAGRLLNILSFTRAVRRFLRRTDLRPDLVISETDPFLLPIVAAEFAQRRDTRLLCYLQDIYPDVAEATGHASPGLVTRTLRGKLRSAYRRADQIIVLGRCMRNRLMGPAWDLSGDKIDIVPNWADCDVIQPRPLQDHPFRKQHKLNERFVVMHSGNMGLTQRLDVLVDATQTTEWPDEAILMLVGNGAAWPALEHRIAALPRPDRIVRLDYQPREQLGLSLTAADLHLVSMHEAITGCICPSKLYGIMAAGRPILAIASPETDLSQTVEEYGLGWCVPPGRPDQIAKAVAAAAVDRAQGPQRGQTARTLALSRFDKPVVLKQFGCVLANCLASRTSHPATEPASFTSAV